MADPFHPGNRESDAALLARYCSGDRSAFDRLAQQYLDFVYAAACRQVRDPHLAEDVTQAVFLLPSKKAPRVPGEHLAGWLFRTTRYAAMNARRMHARRQMHERKAAAHRTEHVMPSEIAEANPAILSLDDALASLSRGDRELVLMRYFQGREIPELSESLQLSEAACRKRLTRAIDKLRERFAAHGFQIEASAMLLTLHAAAAQKAPAWLTVGASGSATAGSIAAAASLSMLAMKLKIAVAVLMIAGIGAISVRGLRRTVASAPSTAPATAPVAAAPGDPRAVASAWAAAVASGDVERARSLVAGTADELAMIDGLASAVAAAESLNQFANERFGRGRAFGINILQGVAQKLDVAQVQIDADTATLITVDNPPFKLRLVDGQWRMDGAFLAQSSLRGLSVMAAATERAFERIRAEAEAGVYATRQDCLNAASNAVNEETQLAAKGAGPIFTNLTLTTTQVEGPSPRQAAKAFAAALRAGDARTARENSFGSPEELAGLDTYADFFAAQHELNRAADEKLGASSGPLIDHSMLANWPVLIDRGLLSINGNVAEITNPDGTVTVRMEARDGRWKLSLSQVLKSKLAESVALLQHQILILRQLSTEVGAGAYRTRPDITAVFSRRMSPTSMPTTVPVLANNASARAMLNTLAVALQLGDAERAHAMLYGTPADLRTLDAKLALGISQNELEKAADARFGASEVPLNFGLMLPALGERVAGGQVWLNGDLAELRSESGEPRAVLKRIDDRWKLDVASLIGKDETLTVIEGTRTATKLIAAGIETGAFSDRESARQALARMILQVFRPPPPSTAPARSTTMPQLADDASPRDIVKAFAIAIQLGDAAAARSLVVASESDLKLIDALVSVVLMQKELNAAAANRFGADHAPIMNIRLLDDWAQRADSAVLKLDADTAELGNTDVKQPMRFVRAEGKWKIQSDVLGGRTELLVMPRAVFEVLQQTRTDIESGKYQTREAAVIGNMKLLNASMERAAATTRAAASQPATAPN